MALWNPAATLGRRTQRILDLADVNAEHGVSALFA